MLVVVVQMAMSECAGEGVPGDQQSEQTTTTEQPPAVPLLVTPPAKKSKGKAKQTEKEEAWRAVGEYFTAKRQTTPSPVQSADNDDEIFCKMLAGELRKIRSSSIKRKTKQVLLDTVYSAQDQEEQQSVQIIQLPTVLPAAAATLPVPINESQVLMQQQLQQQLQQQQQSVPATTTSEAELLLIQLQHQLLQQQQQGVSASATSDAELLLQLQQSQKE